MKIFISYRHEDSEWVTLTLFKELKHQLPKDVIFKDFNTIRPGDDFTQAIETNLNTCSVILVIIGKSWVSYKDENNEKRLFKRDDYVCLEIAHALANNKKVIPVLVDGAAMPSEEELPESIKELHKKQAMVISNQGFEMDVFNLANTIQQVTGNKNQYSDFVKDFISGNVKQEDLIKPESNTAFPFLSLAISVLLFAVSFLASLYSFYLMCFVISGIMFFCSLYAYILSSRVNSSWLGENFNRAKRYSKNARLISILTIAIGSILFLLALAVNLKYPEAVTSGFGKDISRNVDHKYYRKTKEKPIITQTLTISVNNNTNTSENQNIVKPNVIKPKHRVGFLANMYHEPDTKTWFDVTASVLYVNIVDENGKFVKVEYYDVQSNTISQFWVLRSSTRAL